MLHIFKHQDGTFDFAAVRKGRYISGSNQHYERKGKVISAIRGNMKNEYNSESCIVQDDSGEKSVIMQLTRTRITYTTAKPGKPYKPTTKKKK